MASAHGLEKSAPRRPKQKKTSLWCESTIRIAFAISIVMASVHGAVRGGGSAEHVDAAVVAPLVLNAFPQAWAGLPHPQNVHS